MFPPGLSHVLAPRAVFPFAELFRTGTSDLPRRHDLGNRKTIRLCFRFREVVLGPSFKGSVARTSLLWLMLGPLSFPPIPVPVERRVEDGVQVASFSEGDHSVGN